MGGGVSYHELDTAGGEGAWLLKSISSANWSAQG